MTAGDERWHYAHSGLAIASAFELPEWAAFAAESDGQADVRIRVGDAALPVARSGEDIAFVVKGAGEWLVRGGREILVRPDPGAAQAQWRLFTLGSAWGALGYQRGLAMWHGSAVAFAGRAVLVCGDSGAGKSTLAAALVARGGTLVADDLSRVDLGAAIWPSAARLKLWGEVVAWLGWKDRALHREWLREDKFHCAVAESAAGGGPVPLAAIVVLKDGEEQRLERLGGAEALSAVLGGTLYRPDALDGLGQWPMQGALVARILATTPAWRLTRPRDLDRLDETARLVESLSI
mgnify:FL=1